MTIQILEKKFVVSTKSIRYKIWGDDYDELLDWKNNFMHSYGLGYADLHSFPTRRSSDLDFMWLERIYNDKLRTSKTYYW